MKEMHNILWQGDDKGVRILRVYSNSLEINIPSKINGCPVTEIGPYCFSASEPKIKGEYYETNPNLNGKLPSVCGNSVESVEIPDEVTTLHNAAFYNCRRLKKISLGSNICSIGSDEFTNCRELKEIILKCSPLEPSGLYFILERIEKDIEVIFLPEKEKNVQGKLYFPEYYEWMDEISPAHIFSRSIHGEGFRMRKCIHDRVIDYDKYDNCFENATVTESEVNLCRIALDRLRWPINLKMNACNLYEETILKHIVLVLKEAVSSKDMELLRFLFSYFKLLPEVITEGMNLCHESEWIEGSAFFMEKMHRNGERKKKTFIF